MTYADKRWWHANRGEATVAEIDLRVGGKWRYVMIADDRRSPMDVGLQDALDLLEGVASSLA